MYQIDRKAAQKAFAEYVAGYDETDEKIHLKIVHTGYVAGLCERIAADLLTESRQEEAGQSEDPAASGWKRDVDISWLSGLLHDIGRFEQLRRYHTFLDRESVNHAEFGADLLFKEGLAERFLPAAKSKEEEKEREELLQLLEPVIRVHNAFRVPENLPARTRWFADILRDADKIDILRVSVTIPTEEIYNVTTEELQQAEVSDPVMEAVRAGHAVKRTGKATPADYLVGHISMMNELVFPISRQIVKEQGHFDTLCAFQSRNPKTNRQFDEIRALTKNWMNGTAQKELS